MLLGLNVVFILRQPNHHLCYCCEKWAGSLLCPCPPCLLETQKPLWEESWCWVGRTPSSTPESCTTSMSHERLTGRSRWTGEQRLSSQWRGTGVVVSVSPRFLFCFTWSSHLMVFTASSFSAVIYTIFTAGKTQSIIVTWQQIEKQRL